MIPLFDIKLELGNAIVFEPEIEETHNANPTVRNVIRNWINDFFLISGSINRIDTTMPGDYLQEIKSFFEIKDCMALITSNLDKIEDECNEFRQQFNIYSYLWTQDPQVSFEKFLTDNEPKVEEKEDDEEPLVAKNNPLLKGCRAVLPQLSLFDEKITAFNNIQIEIQKIPTPKIISWLKIDLHPMKTALEARVIQWNRIYTDFLVHEFKTTLSNLLGFIEMTNQGIRNNPADAQNQGNNELLMGVMKIISDVKDVETQHEFIV